MSGGHAIRIHQKVPYNISSVDHKAPCPSLCLKRTVKKAKSKNAKVTNVM